MRKFRPLKRFREVSEFIKNELNIPIVISADVSGNLNEVKSPAIWAQYFSLSVFSGVVEMAGILLGGSVERSAEGGLVGASE